MGTEPAERTLEQQKQAAAEAAVRDCVSDGMLVGLGTGSTATYAVRGIGELLAAGKLRGIHGVATSKATEKLANEAGIPLEEVGDGEPDVVIDGADEISPSLDLIKGLGGALLREKIVAFSARTQPSLVVVADDSKLVDTLGGGPLPVEVEPFGWRATRRSLESLGCEAVPRTENGAYVYTDGGHLTLDCRFGHIPDPPALDAEIKCIPGALETGIFAGVARTAFVAARDGLRTLKPIHR